MGAALNDPHVVKLIGLLQDFFRERAHSSTRQVLINLKDPMIKQNFRLRDRDEAFALLHSLELITPQVKLTPGTYEVSPRILVGEQQGKKSPRVRTKKTTNRSAEIISKLTLHHQYDQDSCLNLEPLGVRKLGRELNCSASVVSAFFKREFGDYKSYAQMCRNAGLLAKAISMLRGELRPSILNQRLPGNDGRDVPDR